MFKEIGSDFWLMEFQDQEKKNNKFEMYGITQQYQTIYTSSGRGAFSLILDHIKPAHRTALLPLYFCESIALPLISRSYEIFFYETNKDLTTNVASLLEQIEKHNTGLVYFISYFGFDTLANTRKYYPYIRNKNSIIIEDFTHLLFSKVDKSGADYYLASLRKWFALPDGGIAISAKERIDLKKTGTHEALVELNLNAMHLKHKYVQNPVPGLKDRYRKIFASLEELLNKDCGFYQMSDTSRGLLSNMNFNELCNLRRENYQYLNDNLNSISWLKPVFNSLPGEIVPIFYPIYLDDERDGLQKHLASNNIYTPVHWPVPWSCKGSLTRNTEYIYNFILSIPCDQRYNLTDMERIISEIRGYRIN